MVSQADRTREHLIETYRRKARHYDLTSRLYPAPGYPQRSQRLRAVGALGLRPGARVLDLACGTGLNFGLIQERIGPAGQLTGVDLTDAMLGRARQRVAASGWRNVTLVQADAAEFDFPAGVDAIVSTYALSQVPECAQVIARAAAALAPGGRCAVLDLKIPDRTPGWLARGGPALVRSSAALEEWISRRPWAAIRAAMAAQLAEASWTELCLGTAFLAAGAAPAAGGDRRRDEAAAVAR
jgi:demethylmenaquinone methyltransferase/2-methoxy-6-polyprenyl-1,4-benzoquinol methylase